MGKKVILVSFFFVLVFAVLFYWERTAETLGPSLDGPAAAEKFGVEKGHLLPRSDAGKIRKRVEPGKGDGNGDGAQEWDLSKDPLFSRLPRAKQVRIQVFSRSTGRSVPGAIVGYGPYYGFKGFPGIFYKQGRMNRVDWIFRHGLLVKADSEGKVVIPLFPFSFFVAARSGKSFGFLRIPFSLGFKKWSYRLWIGEPTELGIQVVDRKGMPVRGAPVCVLGNGLVWKGVTKGDKGIAFAKIPCEAVKERPRVEVAFAFPFPFTGGKIVDLKRLPDKQVRLVLPSSGSFGIRLKREDGKVWTKPVFLSISIRNQHFSATSVKRALGGTVFFPFFGLGLEVDARILHEGCHFFRSFGKWDGPTSPGERKWVDLVVRPRARVRCRALDPFGKPMSDQVLFFQSDGSFRGLDLYLWVGTVLTDREGFFYYPRPWGHGHSTYKITAWRKTGLDGMPLGLQCFLDIPSGPDAGDLFLGDVVFQNMDVLAQGKVVDEKGRGLGGVRVDLQEERLTGSKRGRDWYRGVSGPQGRFVIRGIPTGGALGLLRITLKKDGYLGVSRRINPGSKRLVYKLKKLSSVEGVVTVDPGIPMEDLSLRASRKGAKACVPFLRGNGKGKASFLLHLPEDGVWKVRVCARKTPLAEKRIDVAPGGRVSLDFHLEGKLGLYRVKAVNPKGNMVYAFWIDALCEDGKTIRVPPVDVDLEDGGVKIFILPRSARILAVESEDLEARNPVLVEGEKNNEIVLPPKKSRDGR